MSGWIKLHRSMKSHWLWEGEKFTKGQAWIDLLLWARHTPGTVRIRESPFHLDAGQQVRSEVTLSKTWGWSRDKVRRYLKHLEDDGMIRQHKTNVTSIITICNYCDYQHGNTPSDTANKTATKHQIRQQQNIEQDTIEEGYKNEDNDKEKTLGESSDSPKQVGQGEEPKKRKTKQAMPDDFAPNETNARIASELGVDLQNEVLKFSDHHGAKGSKFVDWNLALNTWLRNAVKFSQQRSGGRQPMKTSFENADYSGYDTSEPDWLGGGNGQA